jgi:peptidyl-prolyl cis-trans isomerase A (cyclophilin A)
MRQNRVRVFAIDHFLECCVTPSWMNLKAAVVAMAVICLPAVASATLVRFDTTKGPIDIELLDAAAPKTVANFLSYVRSGAFNNSMFHRHAVGFVLQGGGYTFPPLTAVPKAAPVQNEFSATRSNLRGTVAMAKQDKLPNSATSEWFVNLANNSGPCGPGTTNLGLDCQNSGFTVFGRVTAPGMAIVDAIAGLQVVNAGAPFDTLPVYSLPASGTLGADNLVIASVAKELATTGASETDRVLNYLEAAFPQFLRPASPATSNALGYEFRYYAKTNAYVGTKDGNVYYLVPAISPDIRLLGPLVDWLVSAIATGY